MALGYAIVEQVSGVHALRQYCSARQQFVIPAKGEAGVSRRFASRPLNRVAMQGNPWERIQSMVFQKSWADWVPAFAGTTSFKA